MMRSKKTVECPHCTLQNWHSIFLNYNFVISPKRVKISFVNSLQEGNIIFSGPQIDQFRGGFIYFVAYPRVTYLMKGSNGIIKCYFPV